MAGGYKNVVTYDTFQALIKFSSFLPLLRYAARLRGKNGRLVYAGMATKEYRNRSGVKIC